MIISTSIFSPVLWVKKILDEAYKDDNTKIFKLIQKGDQNLKAKC